LKHVSAHYYTDDWVLLKFPQIQDHLFNLLTKKTGGQKCRNLSSTFKTQVVLEALREREPLNRLASRYGIHSNQIKNGKTGAGKL